MNGVAADNANRLLLEIVAARHRWLNGGSSYPPVADALVEAAEIARALVDSGRATMSDLEELAIAGAPPHRLGDVIAYVGVDAAMLAAVLAGWREAGVEDAGQRATPPPGGWAVADWDGISPTTPCLVLAAEVASSARTVGLTTDVATEWAAGGVMHVPDWSRPIGGSTAFIERTTAWLSSWAQAVPSREVPLWVAAGFTPEDASQQSPLPLERLHVMAALRCLINTTPRPSG